MSRPEAPLPEDGSEVPFDGTSTLIGSALVLLLGGGSLLWLLSLGEEKQLAAELMRTDLERKASLYTVEARRMLEGSQLSGYVGEGQRRLLDFERLIQQSRPDDPVAFVHVRDEDSETLLFKGPDTVQKITVSPHRVEVMDGDGTTVRRILVQEGEGPPQLVDVEQPLVEALGSDLVKEALASPEQRLGARIKASRDHRRRRLVGYSLAGLLLVTLVFAALSWQFGRIRHLERQVRRQKQLAYLGTLAGGLAHEIRNPLHGIGLNLSLLEETLTGADERVQAHGGRLLGRIKPALEHLETIVGEFLDFARPRPMHLEPVHLDRLLEEVREFLDAEARENGIALKVQVAEEAAGFRMQADRERLRQVLMNLARNAFEAQPDGGKVLFDLRRPDRKTAALSVSDAGPGIPPDRLEQVFRIFYTTRDSGLGLGLPIVRRVVEDHGGSIQAESSEAGACFRIRLPLGG